MRVKSKGKGIALNLHKIAQKTKAVRFLRYLWFDSVANSTASSAVIYGGMRGAPKSIYASMFAWTDLNATVAVITAATAAGEAGQEFDATVLLDAGAAKASDASNRAILSLFKCGAKIYLVSGRTAAALMHTKFCIVDGKVAYVGSVNFSVQGRTNNVEVALEDRRVLSGAESNRRVRKWIKRKKDVQVTKEDILAIQRCVKKAEDEAAEKKRKQVQALLNDDEPAPKHRNVST